jgi:uncharacterized protein (DUF58 family)
MEAIAMTPSPRLLKWMSLGLIIALLPIVIHQALWPVVVFFWLGLATLIAYDCIPLMCGQPKVEISQPSAANVGEPTNIDLLVHWELRSPMPCTFLAETEAPLLPGERQQATLYPGATELSLSLEAPTRGEGYIYANWMKITGPLGLFQRISRVVNRDPKVLPILPSLPKVRRIALQHFGAWQYRGGIRLEHLPGDGSEFDALEAYAPGHDLRSIDWKATARHQQLRVRRYRIERNQRLVICLDTGHLMAEPLAQLQRLDHAIHASLLLSYFALKAGDLVGLYGYADTPHSWFAPASGMRHFQRLHQVSATFYPSFVETNHVLGLHELLRKLKRRTLVVVFSEFTDATSAELMMETLDYLVRKHLVIFVALDDPLVEEPLQAPPRDIEQIAQNIVATDLRHERHRIFKQLKRKGIHVVNGSPDGAAVQLVAKYTEIKRRELIG